MQGFRDLFLIYLWFSCPICPLFVCNNPPLFPNNPALLRNNLPFRYQGTLIIQFYILDANFQIMSPCEGFRPLFMK